jgi:serine/threonine protein kinase
VTQMSSEPSRQAEPHQQSDRPSIERLIFLQRKFADAKKVHGRARYRLDDEKSSLPSITGSGAHRLADLTPGTTYTVNFSVTHHPGYANETLHVNVDGTQIWETRNPADTSTLEMASFTATKASHVLAFANKSPTGEKSVVFDEISVVPHELNKEEERRLSEFRQASQKLDEEMEFLCRRWPAREYPDLYNNYHATRLKRFMDMKGLVPNGVPEHKNIADALIFYKEWKRVQTPSVRHELYFAALDGDTVALKAYGDLNSRNQKLIEDRLLLIHSLQHPNITSILAVLVCKAEAPDHETGSSLRKLLVQTPRYERNLKSWLQMQLVDAPAELQAGCRHSMGACTTAPEPQAPRQTWIGPVETRKQLLLGVLQAIKYVHQHGLVHNNVKLDNILIGGSSEAVLTDFGMPRQGVVTASITSTSVQAYTAPELQTLRRHGAEPSPASDMYSIGVVLLLAFAPENIEMVESGQEHVHAKAGGGTAARNLATFHRSRIELPDALQTSVRSLLGREVANRPTADQMLLDGGGVFGPSEGVPTTSFPRWCLCLSPAASARTKLLGQEPLGVVVGPGSGSESESESDFEPEPEPESGPGRVIQE